MPINSKAKGNRGERDAVKFLEGLGLKNPRRGLSQVLGAITADVECDSLDAFWVEVKFTKVGSAMYQHLEQAEKDSKNTPKIPIVLYRDKNKKWCVFGDAEYLIPILVNHI